MRRRLVLVLAAAALLAAVVAGCGGSGSGAQTTATGAQTGATTMPTGPSGFPLAAGQDVHTLGHGLPHGPILAPSTIASLEQGPNRFAFALFTAAQQQVTDATAAIYTADRHGRHLRGPYVARRESLAVAKRYRSRTTAQDPDAAKDVYVAQVPFAATGRRLVFALARINGQLEQTTLIELDIPPRGTPGGVPDVGERPPRVHTPTLASVHGDAKKIDTRVPPALALLRTDFADVLGKRPVVLTFATPLLCQSRVCGPVVDVEDEVAHEDAGQAAFIHVEIYKGNKVANGFLPQVEAFHLPTEPWTFVIDRHGIIRARFEGALSVAELRAAVAKVAARR